MFQFPGFAGRLDSRTAQKICAGSRTAGSRAGYSFKDFTANEGGWLNEAQRSKSLAGKLAQNSLSRTKIKRLDIST